MPGRFVAFQPNNHRFACPPVGTREPNRVQGQSGLVLPQVWEAGLCCRAAACCPADPSWFLRRWSRCLQGSTGFSPEVVSWSGFYFEGLELAAALSLVDGAGSRQPVSEPVGLKKLHLIRTHDFRRSSSRVRVRRSPSSACRKLIGSALLFILPVFDFSDQHPCLWPDVTSAAATGNLFDLYERSCCKILT